ncbi:ABC transporter permease [Rathayibacter sp. VKM Ac-2927]|uniref:ABC transporter permease n=1 Tax=Rathayibacter sp. VKM Ac-2927 TaxID=2929478 RepID=UPI0027E21267|nr:ABC transporter permease [Rathayibacter sp. VKM Ac-2927]
MRRWRSHSRLFALVVAVAVLAGSVLCGALLLVRSSEQAGVSGALTSLGSERVDVTVRVLGPGSPVTAAREAADTATREAYGGDVLWTSSGWASSEWATTAEGVYSYLVELDDPATDAVLTAGAWPTAAPGVALPEIAARSLGLAIGDSITLGDEAPLRIDGLYSASRDSTAYWENDPLLAQGDVQDFAEPNRSFYNPVHAVGPLITAPGGLDASGLVPAQLEAVESPEFPSTGVEGLAELRAAAGDADLEIARAVPHPNGSLFVDTELPAALDDVADGLAGSRAAALVVALLLAVVLVVCARAVTGLLAEARREEIERLRERGATPLQRVGAVAVDGLAVAAVIAALSPWGGVLLHALVVSAPPLDAADLPRWVLPDAAALHCAAAVALVVGVLVALPPAPAAGRGPLAAAGQTVLVVVAAVLVWRAATGGTERGDLLLTLTPALLLGAIAVVGARLAELAALPVAAVAVRSRGAVAPLAGWFAARGSGRSTGIVLVALTVGASVVALGASATWQQGVRDEAAVALGAPARSSVSADGAPVLRRQSLVAKEAPPGLASEGPGAAAQILALDARARQLLGTGAGPVPRAGGADIARELRAEDRVDTGPALPGGTTGLQLLAALDAPEGLAVEVSAAVEDERGRIDILPLGALTSPTEPVTLATAEGAIDPAASLRLVALTATLRDVETDTFVSVDVSLESLATLSAGSDTPVPLALTDAAEWAGSRQDTGRRPPEVAVTATGVRLSILTQLSSAPTTYGAVGWDPEEPVGAVLPEALADDLDVLAGAAVTAFVAGTPVSLRMVGDTPEVPGAATSDDLASLAAGLPSSPRSDSTIVVDGRALAHRLVQADAFGSLVDEYWSAEAPGTAGATTADEPETVTAASLARRMQEAPLRAEIPAASAVVVWASLLLALAGFSARAAAVARARRLEAAQLRAIGLSRRGMLAVLSADTAATALAGVLVGLAGGWAVLALTGSRLAAGASGRPVDLVVPWQAVSLLPLALLLALAAVSAALALAQRRLPLSELLRQGADG